MQTIIKNFDHNLTIMTNKTQKRWLYVLLILLNIPLGLATRWYPQYFTPLLVTYGGDAFAASCIFFGSRFLFPGWSLQKVLLISYLLCILDEVQQLYQAPWAVKFRNITVVGILLGHGFLWSDLVCYAVGVLLGVIIGTALETILAKAKANPAAY